MLSNIQPDSKNKKINNKYLSNVDTETAKLIMTAAKTVANHKNNNLKEAIGS